MNLQQAIALLQHFNKDVELDPVFEDARDGYYQLVGECQNLQHEIDELRAEVYLPPNLTIGKIFWMYKKAFLLAYPFNVWHEPMAEYESPTFGYNKINVIKAMRDTNPGLGLKDAKLAVDFCAALFCHGEMKDEVSLAVCLVEDYERFRRG